MRARNWILPLALLPAAACAPLPAQAQMGQMGGMGGMQEMMQPPPFLEVTGNAEVQVAPDRATVVFAVETEAPTAAEAGQDNANRMTAVLAAVRGLPIEGLRVESFGYNLQPVYRYDEPDRRQRIDGYTVRNHVRAIVPDPTVVGRIIDAAVGAGANRVASLSFEASETDEARQEALRLAVERARGQAEAIAGAMGATLGGPLEVRGGADVPRPFQPMMRSDMMAMAQEASTPIEAGSQTVSASVTIKYRIEGR